jgi:hypothetical protein
MKKEELSVKDLIINDWVNVVIEGEFYPSVITKMDRDTEDVKVAFLAVPGDWEEGDFFDDIQPIPLTSELLEQNGFERVPQPGCANPYHWMLEKYEEESNGLLYRIKAYNTPFRGIFVSIDNPSACETISFGKQIEFVHEFQHALRICEIELEIKLED